MAYDFYFDEAFHTRKITNKENRLNIESNEVENFYVGCFVGSQNWDAIIPKLEELENKYKVLFSLSDDAELKSKTLVNKGKLQNGLVSVSMLSKQFYIELCDVLSHDVKLHFNVLNKYEFLVRCIFPKLEWFENNSIDYAIYVYSFTKFIIMHSQYDIESILISEFTSKQKLNKLIKIFDTHIFKIKGIFKKQEECSMCRNMIAFFRHPKLYLRQISFPLNWDYMSVIGLFCLYFNEHNMRVRSLYIDNEANTSEAARKILPVGINIECLESKENICIRVCDWIAGLISKLLYAYDCNYVNSDENEDLSEAVHLLDSNFFEMDDLTKQFVLKLSNFLIDLQPGYWDVSGSKYSDCITIFYTFLKYSCHCIENNINMTPADFNEMLCCEQQSRLLRM